VVRSLVSITLLDIMVAHIRAASAWIAVDFVGCTYLEVLVGGLLVLLGHGGRLATGEEAGGTEQNTSSTKSDHDVHEDLHVLSGGCLSTGTVRAKGDPVGWRMESVSRPM
jgi:hypothetical protein